MSKKSKQKPEEEKVSEADVQSGGGSKPEPKDPPKPQAKSGDTITNVGSAVHYVCGNRVAPGGTYTLTDRDKADETAMKRLARAVKNGALERG